MLCQLLNGRVYRGVGDNIVIVNTLNLINYCFLLNGYVMMMMMMMMKMMMMMTMMMIKVMI